MSAKTRILRALRRHFWGMEPGELSRILSIPEPSVRRCVSQLRLKGHNIARISSASPRSKPFYRLYEVEPISGTPAV